jgi:hypothetical protein
MMGLGGASSIARLYFLLKGLGLALVAMSSLGGVCVVRAPEALVFLLRKVLRLQWDFCFLCQRRRLVGARHDWCHCKQSAATRRGGSLAVMR